MKLSEKLSWTANSYPESTDFDSYLFDHINDPTNSPNFKPDNIKDEIFLSELKKIVNSDPNFILSDETIDKIEFLCMAYNIDPVMEGSEDDPGLIVSEIILRNEDLKYRKKNPTELAFMNVECASIGFESGADPDANTVSLRGIK